MKPRRLKAGEPFEKTVQYGPGGCHALVYTGPELEGGGARDLVGAWYGTRAQCEALDPREVDLFPPVYSDVDPFDLACERRWD